MKHKPCPFCGGEPEMVTEKISKEIRPNRFLDTIFKYICCTKCKVKSGKYKIEERYWADECTTKHFEMTEETMWKMWDNRLR